MSAIGTITLNLHSVDRDETIYKTSAHNVSHTDLVALRRIVPKADTGNPLRTQIRFERGFPVSGSTDGLEKKASVSIAMVAPPGVDAEDVEAFVASVLGQVPTVASGVAITGDIHLA